MVTLFKIASIVTLLTIAGSGMANGISDIPLEKKVKISGLVAIGSATSDKDVLTKAASGYRYQKIKLSRVLKGAPSITEVWVETSGRLPEQNIDCCEVGKIYLFFLEKRNDGFYVSVNGPYGIYRLN